VEGEFAPACRHKCGWLLPFMLQGLEVAAPRGLGAEAHRAAPLKVLYRDAQLLAVEKPEGLLSVPGKGEALVDSVQTRLREEFPTALLVHRLDLDTSGVVLVALDEDTYRSLQAQFAARTVEKRYVAWLAGGVARDEGRIELPLRVDLEDRPRQIHDPVHGRHAVTAFRVLERQATRTRVELRPLTGRTHQLRVHASHPLGLGAPIEGDRLYGARGGRLMLHAEQLTFLHPVTGVKTQVVSPAEF
jgi:tRNA pseudouridine32 synthase/23S rRNA pseudouridine746 synthase